MSIQGKKIATINLAADIAKAVLNTEIEAIGLNPLIAECIRRSTLGSCQARADMIKHTPHQYFNSLGKLDKRKQRRYDRKVGVKVHTARIIRAKVGKPIKPIMIGIDPTSDKDESVRANVTIKNGQVADIAILDECGVHGGDE